MKRFLKIFVCLISILGFATSVNAASYNVNVYQNGTNSLEYVNGLKIYSNKSGSYNVYFLNTNTYFTTNTLLSNPKEIDKGFSYIINNSNVTNNSDKNYYIAQIAILWYEDYLNGNNANISSSLKDSITSRTNDTVCYYITKLVNNAKEFSKSGNLISFVDNEITFSRNGDYYYSNVIDVEVNGLNSKPNVTVYNAPSSTTIINNTVTNNGTGSFQIRIPVSSLNNVQDKDFIVNVTGTGYNYKYYKYSNGVNNAIYGAPEYQNQGNIEASMVARISNVSNMDINIKVLDKDGYYISGLKYNVYRGNCNDVSCNSNDLVTSFTTKKTYVELENILTEGTYTFVLMSDTDYNLPEKKVLYLNNLYYDQFFVISEDSFYDDTDYDNDYENNDNSYINEDTECEVGIISNLGDSTNIIKIYKNDGTLLDSFRSDKESHLIIVYLGKYYIKDSNGLIDLEFEMTHYGLKVNGEYTESGWSIIDLKDYLIDNTQEENIYTDEDGTIHIDNLDNIESIDISQKVETSSTIEWLSNIVDCPITSLSSTIKYVIGAIMLGIGSYLVVKNVKKQKNNI